MATVRYGKTGIAGILATCFGFAVLPSGAQGDTASLVITAYVQAAVSVTASEQDGAIPEIRSNASGHYDVQTTTADDSGSGDTLTHIEIIVR